MPDEAPRYRLTRPAHIAPVPGQRVQFMDAGREIVYEGIPGFHMEPINEAAKAAVKKTFKGGEQIDPERAAIQSLATSRFDPDKRTGINAPG